MYRPRITAQQLETAYGTCAQALADGDFFTALRLAGGDAETAGICRVMLGNEVAGCATLDGLAHPSARSRLFSALGHWLIGHDDVARARAAELEAGPSADVLRAAMAVRRPRIAFFSGTEKMLGFVRAVREAGQAEIVTIGHRPDLVDLSVTPATDPEALAAAVGPIDALYIDNLTILPSSLATIQAPTICQFYDIEHSYAARGAETGWIDWLVAGPSGEHFEAGLRFGRPALQRGIGLTELWPDLSGLRGLAENAACDRPIDVLYTGGIDMPFYPDKRTKLAALAQVDGGLRIEIHGRMLEKAEYYRRLAGAKFVFSSNRSPNCTPKRLIESLAHGALLLSDEDSSLELLFDCDGAVAKTCGNGTIVRDVEAHVRAYADYAARLKADSGLAVRLLNEMPTNERAVCAFVRYVTLLSTMTRLGISWRGLLGEAEPLPARVDRARAAYAAKHSDMQAYQPALRRALFAPLADDDEAPLAERMVALASLAICDRQEHLLRRQPLGRQKAAAALMAMLNHARRQTPTSVTVWVQVAELLVDLGRLHPAAKVLGAIGRAWPMLTIDERPTLVTPAFEYEDYALVDGLIRDALRARDPELFPGQADMARHHLRIRLVWLQARVARQKRDMAGLGDALDALLEWAPSDPWLIEQALMLAAAGAGSDRSVRFLERLCLFYLRGARLCPRFLNLHFPLALQAMALLDRVRLARLTIRRFLKAKTRVHLMAAEMPVTAAERTMLQSFGPEIADGVAGLFGTPMQAPLARWLTNAAAA